MTVINNKERRVWRQNMTSESNKNVVNNKTQSQFITKYHFTPHRLIIKHINSTKFHECTQHYKKR